jgi:alpha-N-arabinofuranosidase
MIHKRALAMWLGFLIWGAASLGAPGSHETDPSGPPTIRVTRSALCPGEISPFQYGQFIEYLCTLVPGMWAEKLSDDSFEGLTPYKGLVFLKETDFREKPWYPSGAVNRADFSLDSKNPVSGCFSKKIAVRSGAPCTVGISQDGIAVQSGQACDFSCYLRQHGLKESVQVCLHREGKIYARSAFEPSGEWVKYRVRLVPSETDANATLTITFHGPGTLWIDNASLMPVDNVGGWRRDVVEAVRELRPSIIRFGGSALDDPRLGEFDWRASVGDPDRRKPFRAWGGLQPAAAGLEEIVQFCLLVRAEPLICVRFSGREPKNAADEVQYFNGAPNTPMGALRARNGHREPYGIKYWQVGNEREGRDYEARVAAFCKAIKEADPSIKLLSSFPNEAVLRAAGPWLDYVCPHHYDIADLAGAEKNLIDIRSLIKRVVPDRPIKVGVTEWNTTAGDAGPRRARLWTLENALACSRYQNLLHRHCDLVEIANRSNLTNSFCSGIIQTDNHRLYKTPTYYAQQLYALHAGKRPLRIEPAATPDTLPDVSATLSSSGDRVILFVANPTLGELTRRLDLSAFGDSGQELAMWTLRDRDKAGEPDVTNNFADPERVVPVVSKRSVPASRFDYSFPPLSLTVLEWRILNTGN